MLNKSDSIYLILIFLFMKYFKIFRINIKNKVRFYGINFVIYIIIFYAIKYLIVNIPQKKLIEGHRFFINDDGELAVNDTTRDEKHLCEIIYGYSDIDLNNDAEQICREPLTGGPGNCSEFSESNCPASCSLSVDKKIPGDRFECDPPGTNECWRRSFINQSEIEKNHCLYDEENDNWVPNPSNNTIMSMSSLERRNIECKCNVGQHRHPEDNEQDCGTNTDGETVGQPGRNCNLFPLESLEQNNRNLCTSPTVGENDSCNDNTVSSEFIDLLLENDCSMLDGKYRINDKCKSVNGETLTFDGNTTEYITSDLARYIINEKCQEFENANGEQCIGGGGSTNDEINTDTLLSSGFLFCKNPENNIQDRSCEDNTISEETYITILEQDIDELGVYNLINEECNLIENNNGNACIANPILFDINIDCQGHWSECGEDLSYCQRNGLKLENITSQEDCNEDDMEWVEDIVNQCEKKYVIDQPSVDIGAACEYNEGETETCGPGEGQCPITGSWHIATGRQQTCNQFCSSIGKTCGVNTNSLSNGGIFAEDLEGDGGNLPTFPNQRWYGNNYSSAPLQSSGEIYESIYRRYQDGGTIHRYNDWNDYGTPEEVNSLRSQRPTLYQQPILDFFSELSHNGSPIFVEERTKYNQRNCRSYSNPNNCRGGYIKGPYRGYNRRIRNELEQSGIPWWEASSRARRYQYSFWLPDWKLNPENGQRTEEEARVAFCNTAGSQYGTGEYNICWCE